MYDECFYQVCGLTTQARTPWLWRVWQCCLSLSRNKVIDIIAKFYDLINQLFLWLVCSIRLRTIIKGKTPLANLCSSLQYITTLCQGIGVWSKDSSRIEFHVLNSQTICDRILNTLRFTDRLNSITHWLHVYMIS